MGCHRSQRSSLTTFAILSFSVFYFSWNSSRAEPLEKRRSRKLRDSSSLFVPFLPRMKVSNQSELSFPESFLSLPYIASQEA